MASQVLSIVNTDKHFSGQQGRNREKREGTEVRKYTQGFSNSLPRCSNLEMTLTSRCIHIYTSEDWGTLFLLKAVESSHSGIPLALLTCTNPRAGKAWLTWFEMLYLGTSCFEVCEQDSIIIFFPPGKSLLSPRRCFLKSPWPDPQQWVLCGNRHSCFLLGPLALDGLSFHCVSARGFLLAPLDQSDTGPHLLRVLPVYRVLH